jgi:hypothetical protein
MGFEDDNTIIRPMKPSHVDFEKSKIKEGHIEVLNRFGYCWSEGCPPPRSVFFNTN